MMKINLTIFCVALFLTSFGEASSKTGRIVSGALARAGQFPFAAAIHITTPTGRFFCGGVLINNDYVVTAGQCVVDATLFTIHLGSNSLQGDENQRVLATDNYFLHPDYNPDTLENDIALIKFRSYITFDDYVTPLRIWPESLLPDGSYVTTMGWGQTSDDTPGPVEDLYYVSLLTLSNEECKITFGSQITDTMVCVAGNFNQGTCLGDSGSPLIQYGANLPYLVGISSFVSANGCDSPDPSGFTRTSFYVEWIRNVTISN